jgi:large subunit ribosomal protein L10
MAKADKATAVADIAERFKEATATVVTEYRGLTVANLAELRRSLGESATYTVAKNTLVKRAAEDAGMEGLEELLVGPTAITFITGEPVDAAKALRDFARTNQALVIKGGFMDGRTLTVAEVNQLADLESREVLLSKLAGAMKGTMAKAAGPGRQACRGCRGSGRRRRHRHHRGSGRRRELITTPLRSHTPREEAPPWRSCPPTSCSTPSRTSP